MDGISKMSTEFLDRPATLPLRQAMSGPTMGTRWSAIVNAQLSLPLASVGAALQNAVDVVDRQMSTWKPESDLMRFNGSSVGEWIEMPEQLCHVVALGLQIGKDSDGAFDVGMGMPVATWGLGAPGVPHPVGVRHAPMSPLAVGRDIPELELEPEGRRLRRHSGVQLDLSGIAKGYGVDCLADVLEAFGIEDYLVSIDGEIRASGLEFGRPISIGTNVWIGAGAIILPGVSVGDDAIIGAGSVVTRDVPARSTVVGNPVRALSNR